MRFFGLGRNQWDGTLPPIIASAAFQWWKANVARHEQTWRRTLMIHGSYSVIYRAGQKDNPESWLAKLIKRRNINIAAVALGK